MVPGCTAPLTLKINVQIYVFTIVGAHKIRGTENCIFHERLKCIHAVNVFATICFRFRMHCSQIAQIARASQTPEPSTVTITTTQVVRTQKAKRRKKGRRM